MIGSGPRACAAASNSSAAWALHPLPADRILRPGRHGPACLETPEMIEAHDVHLLQRRPEAGDPPGVAVLCHHIPTVEWVAPQLTGGTEVIRRYPGHHGRLALRVTVEQLLVRPGIHAVVSYKERDVADDADAVRVGVGFQACPLLVE